MATALAVVANSSSIDAGNTPSADATIALRTYLSFAEQTNRDLGP